MKKRAYSKVISLRPKKTRKKRRIILPLAGIFLCLIIYLGFLRNSYGDIYIAKEETVKEIFSSEAVVVKNEKVINSPAEGKLELLVKAGERVRVNSPLFKVVTDADKKESLERDISELQEKLDSLKGKKSVLSFQLLDKSIADVKNKLKEAKAKGQTDKVASLENDLLRLEKERLKAEEENLNAIKMLEKSLELQKRKLEEVEPVILSPMAGIVSFNIDGYEGLLKPDKVDGLSYDEIKDITTRAENPAISDSIKVNQAVLKIVDNFSLYIVTQSNREDLQEGRRYTLRFPELNLEVKADLKKISEEEQTAVFSVKEVPFELLDRRKVDVEIVVRTYSGIGVPVSAIVPSKGKEGVFLFYEGKLSFKPVRVVAKDDEKAIVDGLKVGDRVLIKRGFLWRLFGRT